MIPRSAGLALVNAEAQGRPAPGTAFCSPGARREPLRPEEIEYFCSFPANYKVILKQQDF